MTCNYLVSKIEHNEFLHAFKRFQELKDLLSLHSASETSPQSMAKMLVMAKHKNPMACTANFNTQKRGKNADKDSENCTHEIFNTSDLFEEEVPDTAPEELPGIGAVSDSNEKSDSEDYRSEEEDKDSDQEDTDPSASIPIPVSTPTEATEPQSQSQALDGLQHLCELNYVPGNKSIIKRENVAQEIALHLQSIGKWVKAINIVHYTTHPQGQTENIEVDGGEGGRQLVVWFHDRCMFYANGHQKVHWVKDGETTVLWLASPDSIETTCRLFKAGKTARVISQTRMYILTKYYPEDNHIICQKGLLSPDQLGCPLVTPDGKPPKEKVKMTGDQYHDGRPQSFYIPEGHKHEGLFKGMAVILANRGLVAQSKLEAMCGRSFVRFLRTVLDSWAEILLSITGQQVKKGPWSNGNFSSFLISLQGLNQYLLHKAGLAIESDIGDR
ncbi:hypothetical protein FIBSPDRAFT_896848 [Athelia psychrophila]|uniref:Uncharacterized protein n=1 Tax=Athelia psychrophila TaxID=1759441 RepID=A0A166CY07_9AGAM|nr:hypothetical protein FIBSPDRAFT_896848 [Fibularhizoctonia sp. CBS 109695]